MVLRHQKRFKCSARRFINRWKPVVADVFAENFGPGRTPDSANNGSCLSPCSESFGKLKVCRNNAWQNHLCLRTK